MSCRLRLFVCLKNYYAYLIIALAFQIITNIMTAIVAERIYPNYKPKGKLDITTAKDINRRIRDLFTAKLGGDYCKFSRYYCNFCFSWIGNIGYISKLLLYNDISYSFYINYF